MTDLTRALGLDAFTEPETDSTCDKFVGDIVLGTNGPCRECLQPWASHVRGFGSNAQPLSGRVKRVPRA